MAELFVPKAPDLLDQALKFKALRDDEAHNALQQQALYQQEQGRQTRALGIQMDTLAKSLKVAPRGGPAENILGQMLSLSGIDPSGVDFSAGYDEMKQVVNDTHKAILEAEKKQNLQDVNIYLNAGKSSLAALAARYPLYKDTADAYSGELQGASDTIMKGAGAIAQGRAASDVMSGGQPSQNDLTTVSYTQGPEKVAPLMSGYTRLQDTAAKNAQTAVSAQNANLADRKFTWQTGRDQEKDNRQKGKDQQAQDQAQSQALDRAVKGAQRTVIASMKADPAWSKYFGSQKSDKLGDTMALMNSGGDVPATDNSQASADFTDEYNRRFYSHLSQVANNDPLLKGKVNIGDIVPPPLSAAAKPQPTSGKAEPASPSAPTTTLPQGDQFPDTAGVDPGSVTRDHWLWLQTREGGGWTPEQLKSWGMDEPQR